MPITLSANRLLPNWFYLMQAGKKIGSVYAQYYPNRKRNEWVIVLNDKRPLSNCVELSEVIPYVSQFVNLLPVTV